MWRTFCQTKAMFNKMAFPGPSDFLYTIVRQAKQGHFKDFQVEINIQNAHELLDYVPSPS